MKSILITIILLAGSFFFTGFTKNAQSNEPYIMICVAIEKINCNGSSFSKAKGYNYFKFKGKFDYNTFYSDLRTKTANRFGVPETDVYFKYGRFPYAVIIEYSKTRSGWGCKTPLYAVGFGNTKIEAENNAVKSKNNDEPNERYNVEAIIEVE